MYWVCEECPDWGLADTEMDAVVNKYRHIQAEHRGGYKEPEADPDENEDAILHREYLYWGMAALAGLLSAYWHPLAVVVPFLALMGFVTTYVNKD